MQQASRWNRARHNGTMFWKRLGKDLNQAN